ncbi:hypothetical protein MINT15_38620 [Saccharomonospora viridis]|uniref:Uncharacterized protein n=1 Tax=Saccharomonospora viridis TaxID=1852 RepID=A0A837D524_9PSEU|nr:hypothetical protein MINT15_38620 [Saccharomonospora viridis]
MTVVVAEGLMRARDRDSHFLGQREWGWTPGSVTPSSGTTRRDHPV